jgi:hypothetical protein
MKRDFKTTSTSKRSDIEREQYHQTTEAEETVRTSYTLEHQVIQWMYLSFNYCSILG